VRLLLAVVLIALVLGRLLGVRLRELGRLRLRSWGLAVRGLLLQLAPIPWGGDTGRTVAVALLIASYPLPLLFAWRNLHLAGFVLILAGLALNMALITVNEGMPVPGAALAASGQGELIAGLRAEPSQKHQLQGPGNKLGPLADVFPVPTPIGQVISLGDIAMYAGIVWLLVATMRGIPAPRHARGAGALGTDPEGRPR